MVERILGEMTPDCPSCGSELIFVVGREPGDDRLRCDVCEPVRFYRAGDLMGDDAAQMLRSVHDSIVTRNLAEPARDGRPGDTTYGHVVVDEAQDLSTMQWRALARRCPTRSMTIAGDQGQAIRPGGTGSWDAAVAALGADEFDLTELSVNYRTPVEVMNEAESWLAAGGIPFSRTQSVRSTTEPVVHRVDVIDAPAVARVAESIDTDGTIAVIAPALRCAELGAIDVLHAKGLEFDAVVVVDPDGIAAEGEGGARRVYVALTRTTTHLHIIRQA
jgi:DNA helicase IV